MPLTTRLRAGLGLLLLGGGLWWAAQAWSGETTINRASFVPRYRATLVPVGPHGALLVCIEAGSINTLAVSCNWAKFNEEYPDAHAALKATLPVPGAD